MGADVKLYNGASGLPVFGYKVAGTEVTELIQKITMTNGDGAGSIYRFAKIPANAVIVDIKIICEAITSANDNDIGFYQPDEKGGAVINSAILADGLDFSSAVAIGSELNGLRDLGTLNLGVKVADLLAKGLSERQEYTLAITALAAPTATKSLIVRVRFLNAA